MTNLASRYYL